jgi:enterochelin esterase family protein
MSTLAIHTLERTDPLDAAAVDRFLAGREFPIVEGSDVTFVYRGEAEAVNLRHFVFGLPSTMPFQRVTGTDLWYCVLDLPHCSRVEYKFDVVRAGRGEWIRDPLNPRMAHDPFGANSVCHGVGYSTPDWIEPDPEARPGHLKDIVVRDTPFGGPRRVTLYLPARYRTTRRYPLLVVHDGGDYLRYSRLKIVLDNLIHRLEVQPLIAALTHPGDRMVEYPDDPRNGDFLVRVLVPMLESQFPLFGQPRSRCAMGASFGAVASLSAAWRNPGFFGGLLLQSGSFAFTDIGEHTRGPTFDPVVEFVNAFREAPGKPSQRVFISCGQYESLIYENRSMVPLLKQTGMEVRYVEARDGHNWENWRDRLRVGLSWLFPGHLWMVYE